MQKKIILITDASSGIGKETAIQLAKQGHTIIMHGRNVIKTQQAVKEVIAASNNNQIKMVTADLSLMAEVKKLADYIKTQYQRLDVLINNAGAQFAGERKTTSEGHERTFAINTLAPFLLTNLLLPLLKKSADGRVVTVSSESYKMGGAVDWNDIEFKDDYSLTRSYGLTKRYVLWLMLSLSKQLQSQGITNVTVNVCEPGSARTSLDRDSGNHWYFKIIETLWAPFMSLVSQAAETSIFLASSPKVAGKTGGFYGKKRQKSLKSKWTNEEDFKRIWDYCEQACAQYLK